LEYVFDGLALVEERPSPKVHAYVSKVPSGSEEPLLEKFTVNGLTPEV
jgi:hypothetical protein